MSRIFRLGTRKSPLAMAQSQTVAQLLCEAHGWAPDRIRLVSVDTKGDMMPDQALSEVGGKGLFTLELEQKLLSGELDFAVHSLKDLPAKDAEGLCLAAVPSREDARDALVLAPGLPAAAGLHDLPEKTVFGTASLRRRAQLLRHRPDLEMRLMRGNVGTRISKLGDGPEDIGATLLAVAGLKRLGLADRARAVLSPEDMLPAPAQGALGVQARENDGELRGLLASLHCVRTQAEVTAERQFMAHLDGSCRTPIAALARVRADVLTLKGRLLTPDGRQCAEAELSGPVGEAAALGRSMAEDVRKAHPELAAQAAAPDGP